jgi:hypothetical protein
LSFHFSHPKTLLRKDPLFVKSHPFHRIAGKENLAHPVQLKNRSMAELQKNNPALSSEMTKRFVQFVMVQAQNILYVLGRIPTPEGERIPPNLQAAKMMIDHLDLIRVKTEENLTAQETKIISEALQQVQLAFVEASGGTPVGMMPDRGPQVDMSALEEEEIISEETPSPAAPKATPSPAQTVTAEADEKKKYFKSYG